MNTLAPLLPSITNMIRLDHTDALSTFHQYKAGTPPRAKRGLADHLCIALEIHAELEERIFYPAMREADPGFDERHSVDEHQEMRDLIARVRAADAHTDALDDAVQALMNVVMHHVADEETRVLPAAEKRMPDRLGELGWEMTKLRTRRVATQAPAIGSSVVRALSGNKLALALGGVVGLGLALLMARGRASHKWAGTPEAAASAAQRSLQRLR